MILRTLGTFSLSGTDYVTPLPLLILLYQALEGTTLRTEIAGTFWPRGADPLNSLSGKLKHLRKNGLAHAFDETDTELRATIDVDVRAFRAAYAAHDFDAVVAMYGGPFLGSARFASLSPLVEEWIVDTRRQLGELHRDAALHLAEGEAARGAFDEAADRAAACYGEDASPEHLRRIFLLLRAARHPLADEVREEAEYADLYLGHTPEEARLALRTSFIGREPELRDLRRLKQGRCAWIEAATGMGKTALLQQLDGTYLPARSGLPFITLEPLFDGVAPASVTEAVRALRRFSGNLLVDDWHLVDGESREALQRLVALQPEARIYVAAPTAPRFGVDLHVTLEPLERDELSRYPGAWEATGGLPYLVAAFLREESLEPLLGPRLHALEGSERDVYVALCMLGEPDTVLVRSALELSAREFAAILDRLVRLGLVTSEGAVRASPTVQRYLEGQSLLREDLAVRIARQLEGVEAFRFYDLARLLWEDEDLPAIRDAYLARATELLERGALRLARETLGRAPDHPSVGLLRARILTEAGVYPDALRELETLPATPEVHARVGALRWRTGDAAAAERESTRALEGDAPARAEALNTLGHVARDRGDYTRAISYARKAAALWQALGRDEDYGGALNNLAVAKMLAGDDADSAFDDALRVTEGNAAMRAHVLISKGLAHERQGAIDAAMHHYERAADLAQEVGALGQAATARNNIGVIHHQRGEEAEAANAYRAAIRLANEGDQPRTRFMAMANLAELNDDPDAWEEALLGLERAGYAALVEEYRNEDPWRGDRAT